MSDDAVVIRAPKNPDELRSTIQSIVHDYNMEYGVKYDFQLIPPGAVSTDPPEQKAGRLFAKIAFPVDPSKKSAYGLGGDWYKQSDPPKDDTYVVAWLRGSPIKYLCKVKHGATLTIDGRTLRHLRRISDTTDMATLLNFLAEEEEAQRSHMPITPKSLDTWD